jgi:hypothetical protein
MRSASFLPSAEDIIADLALLETLVGISEDCDRPLAPTDRVEKRRNVRAP